MRRSPLLGAALVYGASRAGTRRGMQREAENQQAMEWEVQQRMAAQQSRNAQEEQRRKEEIDKERELIRARLEQEERAKMEARSAQQATLAPPSYAGIDTLFCAECGQQCRVVDKFCNRCGARLPGLVEKPAGQ